MRQRLRDHGNGGGRRLAVTRNRGSAYELVPGGIILETPFSTDPMTHGVEGFARELKARRTRVKVTPPQKPGHWDGKVAMPTLDKRQAFLDAGAICHLRRQRCGQRNRAPLVLVSKPPRIADHDRYEPISHSSSVPHPPMRDPASGQDARASAAWRRRCSSMAFCTNKTVRSRKPIPP